MKPILILLLCATGAVTSTAQTTASLKARLLDEKLLHPARAGAAWAAIENWSVQQVAAARAEQARAVAAVRTQLDAANAANATLLAKLAAARTADALATVRAEVITAELARQRAAVAAELAKKRAELDALK